MSPDLYDLEAAIAVIEDYHPLDVECAAAGLRLVRGIRDRYPELQYLLDGDGGDENLKSYPLEDSDLTLGVRACIVRETIEALMDVRHEQRT